MPPEQNMYLRPYNVRRVLVSRIVIIWLSGLRLEKIRRIIHQQRVNIQTNNDYLP